MLSTEDELVWGGQGDDFHSQCRRSLRRKLAMEDKDMLRAHSVATATRRGQIGSVENIILNCFDSVQVDRTGDMSTSVLVIESAVNDSVRCDLRVVEAQD